MRTCQESATSTGDLESAVVEEQGVLRSSWNRRTRAAGRGGDPRLGYETPRNVP